MGEGLGGFGGGNGYGGGGAALGGAIFVTSGGTLTIAGSMTQSGGAVAGGGGFSNNGSAYGSGIFFQGAAGGGTSTLAFGAGTQSITDDIADLDGAAGNTSTDNGLGGLGGRTALAKLGAGTLTLSGANTYTGGTTFGAGTVVAGSAGALGTAGTLTFSGGTLQYSPGNQTDYSSRFSTAANQAYSIDTSGQTVTYASALNSAGGTLTKLGAGTLTLAGANTYTGATMVSGGTLAVNGSITTSVTTVNAGGTLGGTGTLGNTLINGGVLAPGNSIGTLTVQGNLGLTAASTYRVEVDPATADRTNVTGAATLGGAAVNAVFAPGSYVARQYTILNAAGGRSGTFGALTSTGLPANFSASLSYDTANVYLNLTLDFTPPPAGPTGPAFPPPLNRNQQAVASGLIASFKANGGIPGVYGALMPQGLSQASGEVATGAQTSAFNAASAFLGLLTDPSTSPPRETAATPAAFAADDDALAYAERPPQTTPFPRMLTKASPRIAYDPLWNVWAAGFGGAQTTDGNAALGSATTTSRLYGSAVGADYWLSPATKLGFAVAGGGTNFALNAGLGSGRSDLFQAGVYGRHQSGAAYLAAAFAYGWQDVTTDRFAVTDQLRARFVTNTLSGRIEAGWRYATPWLGVTPYAAGEAIRVALPSYAEAVVAGSGAFALAYAGGAASTTRSELGLRTDKSLTMGDALVTLRGRAAWAHHYDRDRTASATFVALPLASFTVNGARTAANAALVTAAAEINWHTGWSAAATFEGEFSNVTRSYAGKGVVKHA